MEVQAAGDLSKRTMRGGLQAQLLTSVCPLFT